MSEKGGKITSGKVVVSEFEAENMVFYSSILTDPILLVPGKGSTPERYHVYNDGNTVIVEAVETLPEATVDIRSLINLVSNKLSTRVMPDVLRGECLTLNDNDMLGVSRVFISAFFYPNTFNISITYRSITNIAFDPYVFTVRDMDRVYIYKPSRDPLSVKFYVPSIICFK